MDEGMDIVYELMKELCRYEGTMQELSMFLVPFLAPDLCETSGVVKIP